MRIGSLFAGIGGFDLAFESAGAQVVWASEIDPFARKVLAARFPHTEQVGDITTWQPDPDRHAVDLITFGFPCQDLSVAGKREGLSGERSGLFFEAVRVVGLLRPTWLLAENVPGLLSSKRGDDYEAVLTALDELGYGLAWRVFDAQAFGVPQRRRRVFIVGHLGAPCPPEILFESEGVCRDPAPSRKARKGPSRVTARRPRKGSEPAGSPEAAARAIGQIELPTCQEESYGFDPGVIGESITGTVSAKWVKGSGGPSGDEVYNLVAAHMTPTDPAKPLAGHHIRRDLDNETYVLDRPPGPVDPPRVRWPRGYA